GLVPGGGAVELALARNRMSGRTGYYNRWIYARIEPSSCVFTRHLPEGTLLPMPVAHGEGRFIAREAGTLARLVKGGQAPLRYAAADGQAARRFPDNPNGSHGGIAAMCNARGNVLAIMPHPERAQDAGAVARSIAGAWADRRRAATENEDSLSGGGPGLAIF